MKTEKTCLIIFLFTLAYNSIFSQKHIDTINIKIQTRYNYKSAEKYCFKHFYRDRNYLRTVRDTNSENRLSYYLVQDTTYYFRFFDAHNTLRLQGYIYDHEGFYDISKLYDRNGKLKIISRHSLLVPDINDKMVCDCVWKYTPLEYYKEGQLIKRNKFYAISNDSALVIIKHSTNFNRQGKKISEKTYVTKHSVNFKYRQPIFRPLKFIYFDDTEKQTKAKTFRRNKKYHA